MHLAQILNAFQHEEDSVAFKLLELACMKKSNREFFHKQIGDLKSRENEAINALYE